MSISFRTLFESEAASCVRIVRALKLVFVRFTVVPSLSVRLEFSIKAVARVLKCGVRTLLAVSVRPHVDSDSFSMA